jgi:type IV pilus assembly protein PilO
MTNLSGASKRGWFTRQRILIAVPLSAGAIASVAVFLFGIRPAGSRVDELRQRLDELRRLQSSLPAIERTIASAEQTQKQAEQRQALLVDLIADSDSIQTVLALLNRESMASGVMLMQYEPVASTPASSSSTSDAPESQSKKNTNQKGADVNSESGDPLETLGYRRTSMALRVTGGYGALLNFLQRVERLQVLVESSDLELEAVEPPGGDESEAKLSGIAETDLRLKLTFYDRQAPVDQMKATDPSNSDPAAGGGSAGDAPF